MAEKSQKKLNQETGGRRLLYETVKLIFDYLFAIFSLLILSPFMILLAIVIRISGGGPVIFSQDRIGRNGKPFSIFKFRSMVYDAERGVPLLSGDSEERVTKIGRIIRKYRIDELPNLFNVIKGDMSVVGPRPERQFFIDQIIREVPEYTLLQNVKPGITSWGQVKYGYASSVKEMIERSVFDLYYLKSRSLWFDVKIIFCTVGTVLRGRGV